MLGCIGLIKTQNFVYGGNPHRGFIGAIHFYGVGSPLGVVESHAAKEHTCSDTMETHIGSKMILSFG